MHRIRILLDPPQPLKAGDVFRVAGVIERFHPSLLEDFAVAVGLEHLGDRHPVGHRRQRLAGDHKRGSLQALLDADLALVVLEETGVVVGVIVFREHRILVGFDFAELAKPLGVIEIEQHVDRLLLAPHLYRLAAQDRGKRRERRRRLIVVCPAHIRKQWQTELAEKFNLPAIVLDRRVWNQVRAAGQPNPFDCGKIIVISYGFAARMKDDLRAIPFDLVVLDEAHKLRNAYQPSRKGGQAVRWAFELRQKLLLTATPLQNSLLELYGLGWLIDDHVFGDKSAFQSRYCNAGGDLIGLRARLAQVCKRTLRKDCAYINYKKRQAMTHPFPQTDEEKALHQDVMDFMTRDISFAFPQRQRQLIEMILFKTLASSPQALASTLGTMRRRLIAVRDGLPEVTEDDLIDALSEGEDTGRSQPGRGLQHRDHRIGSDCRADRGDCDVHRGAQDGAGAEHPRHMEPVGWALAHGAVRRPPVPAPPPRRQERGDSDQPGRPRQVGGRVRAGPGHMVRGQP